ncbi:hypothetical protein STIAU_3614 [Stigmatella aurantiaca DW4/3-1]|uniref:Uncharacterized protein n=1 Tax=Stigmatella aurantiaca (strain DW4/3-1) TaxID=378806 RepID=Q092D4_STIAD|nr:hypothetical protein STIAU_3614 [Stigmatella aurantiaca DW4/3-1]
MREDPCMGHPCVLSTMCTPQLAWQGMRAPQPRKQAHATQPSRMHRFPGARPALDSSVHGEPARHLAHLGRDGVQRPRRLLRGLQPLERRVHDLRQVRDGAKNLGDARVLLAHGRDDLPHRRRVLLRQTRQLPQAVAGGPHLIQPVGDVARALGRHGRRGLDGLDDLVEDVPDACGALDGLIRQRAHLAGQHGEALALFPRPCRLDGGVDGQQVGLVRHVLHRLGDVADLRGALGQAVELVLHGLHELLEGRQPHHALLDGRLALVAQLLRALGHPEHRLGPLGRHLRGLLDLLRGDLGLLDGRRLLVEALLLLGVGVRQILAGRHEPRGRRVQRLGDLPQPGQQVVQLGGQLADLVRGDPLRGGDPPGGQPLDGHAHRRGPLGLPPRQEPGGDAGQNEHQAADPRQREGQIREQRAAQVLELRRGAHRAFGQHVAPQRLAEVHQLDGHHAASQHHRGHQRGHEREGQEPGLPRPEGAAARERHVGIGLPLLQGHREEQLLQPQADGKHQHHAAAHPDDGADHHPVQRLIEVEADGKREAEPAHRPGEDRRVERPPPGQAQDAGEPVSWHIVRAWQQRRAHQEAKDQVGIRDAQPQDDAGQDGRHGQQPVFTGHADGHPVQVRRDGRGGQHPAHEDAQAAPGKRAYEFCVRGIHDRPVPLGCALYGKSTASNRPNSTPSGSKSHSGGSRGQHSGRSSNRAASLDGRRIQLQGLPGGGHHTLALLAARAHRGLDDLQRLLGVRVVIPGVRLEPHHRHTVDADPVAGILPERLLALLRPDARHPFDGPVRGGHALGQGAARAHLHQVLVQGEDLRQGLGIEDLIGVYPDGHHPIQVPLRVTRLDAQVLKQPPAGARIPRTLAIGRLRQGQPHVLGEALDDEEEVGQHTLPVKKRRMLPGGRVPEDARPAGRFPLGLQGDQHPFHPLRVRGGLEGRRAVAPSGRLTGRTGHQGGRQRLRQDFGVLNDGRHVHS